MKELLIGCGVGGAMFTNINGFGTQKGKTYVYNGITYEEHILPKIKVETIVEDKLVPVILENLRDLKTGHFGDGKVFVFPVEEAMRIRTGELGNDALQKSDIDEDE